MNASKAFPVFGKALLMQPAFSNVFVRKFVMLGLIVYI